jgi:hypothetical protein
MVALLFPIVSFYKPTIMESITLNFNPTVVACGDNG